MTASLASPQRNLGITQRTALLSWLVTLMTLGVFIFFIVPQQKRTFIESLDSKAHGVAVSLRDVAAGAAINDDFSSVVDHSMEMLSGDSSLAYIIITRNDGFSLVMDHSGWRMEQEIDPEWRPAVRTPRGAIKTVSLYPDQIYAYSQPFDYSAIEWGWIHVGLSLESYNQNVKALYRATALLSLVCIVLSLIASVIYAKRLVRPILALRAVVERVSQGELDSRATVHRRDEIGELTASVNLMTETLWRRDRIADSVRHAAEQFLRADDWEHVIGEVLENIGTATEVSRIAIYEVDDTSPKVRVMHLRHHWNSPNHRELDPPPPPSLHDGQESVFSDWSQMLEKGRIVVVTTTQLEGEARAHLERAGIRSILILPIFADGVLWGIINFNDCDNERVWFPAEQNSIRATIDMLGATITRQRAQEALREANNTLEHRVVERTRALLDEVEAKEQARAELADAQQKLIATSRQAGMAEIATGVLHNVGNVLNSVNVTSALLNERLRDSQLRALKRLADLVDSHSTDFSAFVSGDPRGQKVPEFLTKVTQSLVDEREFLIDEHEQLTRNIQHIKDIVAMQQNYARMSGFLEQASFNEIAGDALKINEASNARHQVQVETDFALTPVAVIDKHKTLQICVNLLQNAKDAVSNNAPGDRKVRVQIEQPSPQLVRFKVSDNGVGISAENLTRIFSHGFTTRKQGHGFGLHSGANFAREMGGSLTAASDGPGLGATFTLELPLNPVQTAE